MGDPPRFRRIRQKVDGGGEAFQCDVALSVVDDFAGAFQHPFVETVDQVQSHRMALFPEIQDQRVLPAVESRIQEDGFPDAVGIGDLQCGFIMKVAAEHGKFPVQHCGACRGVVTVALTLPGGGRILNPGKRRAPVKIPRRAGIGDFDGVTHGAVGQKKAVSFVQNGDVVH